MKNWTLTILLAILPLSTFALERSIRGNVFNGAFASGKVACQNFEIDEREWFTFDFSAQKVFRRSPNHYSVYDFRLLDIGAGSSDDRYSVNLVSDLSESGALYYSERNGSFFRAPGTNWTQFEGGIQLITRQSPSASGDNHGEFEATLTVDETRRTDAGAAASSSIYYSVQVKCWVKRR